MLILNKEVRNIWVDKMNKINKNNLSEFMRYYHDFHDSYIIDIHYDILSSKIECILDVCWSGKPILKGNSYETNKTKIKLIFENVVKYENKGIYSWDYINKGFLDYVRMGDKEKICFATDINSPLVIIVCDSIEYEKIK